MATFTMKRKTFFKSLVGIAIAPKAVGVLAAPVVKATRPGTVYLGDTYLGFKVKRMTQIPEHYSQEFATNWKVLAKQMSKSE